MSISSNSEATIPEIELDKLINRLVKTDDPEEVRRLYKQWAASYDADLDKYGYVAPQIGVAMFKELVPNRSAIIHDAGCGTGQVGQLLSVEGYSNLHGSDFSQDMLNVAAQRECYQSLVQADYTSPLEFADNSVDAIISIGVYTKRFKDIFIPELLRILKPKGCLVFSCRPLYFNEVADSIKKMHQEERLSKSVIAFDDYMVGQKASAYYVGLVKGASLHYS